MHGILLLFLLFSLSNSHLKSRYPDFSVPVSMGGDMFDVKF